MLAQLKAAVGEADYGRLSARAAKEAGLSARKVRRARRVRRNPLLQMKGPEIALFGRPHFGRGRAKEKEEEMMIALLHDFLPRGAKRVLIAVAGIFGAAFSFAFVDMMPFLIWMLIFVAADFATVLYAARSTSTYQSSASCRRV